MENITKKLVLILAILLIISSFAYSQRLTGSIKGVVSDEEGNPLPGVTVTASSPSLIGTQTFITTSEGNFRFPSLPPGTYEIVTQLEGFQIIKRANIIVNIGRTVEIKIQMAISQIQEEVLVTAPSPTVDVSTSRISLNISSDFITKLPIARDLYDIQNMTPGAVSDGRSYRRTSSILGGTVRSNLYTMDGVPMNDPAVSYAITNINIDVYDEVQMEMGGHPAEVGQTDSLYINIVTKSGGNKISGSLSAHYSGDNFLGKYSLNQKILPEEQLTALGQEGPRSDRTNADYSFTLGGPIIKDKIWFFANARRAFWIKDFPDNAEYDLEHYEWLGFGKVTAQIKNNLKFMGMLNFATVYEPIYTGSASWSRAKTTLQIYDHEKIWAGSGQLNWIIDQNTFADIRFNYLHRFFPLHAHPGTEELPLNYDYKSGKYWGGVYYNEEYIRTKMVGSVSLTKFIDGLLGGNHELKFGLEYENDSYSYDWYRKTPYYRYWSGYDFDTNTGNPYYFSISQKKGRLRARPCPSEAGVSVPTEKSRRFGGYIQDSIQYERLVFNVGIRFDYQYAYEPEQSRPQTGDELLMALAPEVFGGITQPYRRIVTFKDFAPRLGLVYDLFGDGRTAVKLSYSRYYEPIFLAKYNFANILTYASVYFYWYDLNGNGEFDMPGIDNYVASYLPNMDTSYMPIDKNAKNAHMDEIVAAVEHELFNNFKLSLTYIWKKNGNLLEDIDINKGYTLDYSPGSWIPYTTTEPGMDGVFGTDDDGQITVYAKDKSAPLSLFKMVNVPEAERQYNALILGLEKRMSDGWQLSASFMWSSFKGNVQATYGDTEGDSGAFDNPNNYLVNRYGKLSFDRPIQIRIATTVLLPLDIFASAYLRHYSGAPWNRTIYVYFPDAINTYDSRVLVNAEEPGSRRYQSFTNVDLRIEKTFSISSFGNLGLYATVFNLFGRSGLSTIVDPQGRLYASGTYSIRSNYGDITSNFGVRSVRVGAAFRF